MPVKLNSSGGGSVTLTTPSTASDFTVTVPAVTGSALVSTSGSSTSSTGIDFPSANTVSIKTNGTTAVTVDSSQNVGIGTTSAITSGKLSISNGTNRAIVTAGSTGDVGVEAIRIQKFDNNTTTSQLFIRFTINNEVSGSGQINANGANAAAFGTFSDERLKENIVELPNQLANICALKPSEFDFKDGSGHQIGFIAQEMQEVYPDVVGEGDDGMLTITGWSKTEARLVKAIQELSAKLDAAEARIAALEGAK